MKPFDKETQVSQLDVEQFTALMGSITETKQYINAMREREITERIFKDADGIISAGVVPFKVNSVKDLEEFMKTIRTYLIENTEARFVLAAALLTPVGEYKSKW